MNRDSGCRSWRTGRTELLALSLLVTACGSTAHLDTPADSGLPDGATSGDSGQDSGIEDGGIDAGLADAGSPDAGPDAGTTYPYGYGCSAQQDATGLVRRSAMGADQMMHEYYSYVPSSYDAGWDIPLVVSLHGSGDTARDFITLWETNADQNDFMVLVPEASGTSGDGFTWLVPTDIGVVLTAIEDISRCYRTDLHRHILHGFSAGGILGYIMGLLPSDVMFSGLAISSSDLGTAEYFAQRFSLPPLLPSGWNIPVSISHGLQDPNFPFAIAAEGSRDALLDAGHTVYFNVFDGGHTISEAEVLQQWNDLKSSEAP